MFSRRIPWPQGPFAVDRRRGLAFLAMKLVMVALLMLAAIPLIIVVATYGRGTAEPLRLTLALVEPAASVLLLGAIGWTIVRAVPRMMPWAPLADIPRDARIIPIDLLTRRMVSRHAARWRFAYDWQGRRCYSNDLIIDPPILTCGTVTRGAGLLLPDGSVRMLVHGLRPLLVPLQVRAAAEAEVDRQYNGFRPDPTPGLGSFLATLPPGPARDFVEAWRDAWVRRDIPQVNEALERRHRAAARLAPEEADRLLQRCRATVPWQA